jgi:arginine N-succinyltransferase
VLESLEHRRIVGTAAIHASAGSNGTYFAFRNDVIQQVSRDLNISHSVHALTLCSELTAIRSCRDSTSAEPRHGRPEAALLSRARLLYAVLAPHRFGDRFFVPLAGVTDDPTASRRSGMRWAANSSRWISSTPSASSAAPATAR